MQCDKSQGMDSITVSAFMYGNILARANDVRQDVRGGKDTPEQIASRKNAAIVPIAVGRWPFLFMVATKPIPPSTLQVHRQSEQFKCEAPLLNPTDCSFTPVHMNVSFVRPQVCAERYCDLYDTRSVTFTGCLGHSRHSRSCLDANIKYALAVSKLQCQPANGTFTS